MSDKVQFIYGFTYKFDGSFTEEFYANKAEAIAAYENNARLAKYAHELDSVKITDLTEIRTVVVWKNIYTEETV